MVTEIKQFSVEADTKESALSIRNSGQGALLNEQQIVNQRGNVITPNVKSISPNEWPVWAKALKQFSTPEDKGIGDVVARMIGDENSATFKAWHLATFGRPCNCTARRDRWNRQFPLN